jgi:hypothetical protein
VLRVTRARSLIWTTGYDSEGNELLSLCAGDTRLDIPNPLVAMLVQKALSIRRFLAGDCTDWLAPDAGLSWAEVQEALDVLLEHGVLELA